MRNIEIQLNCLDQDNQIVPELYELTDAVNIVLFENKYDFKQENIQLEVSLHPYSSDVVLIDGQVVDFECRCQDDPQDCHCDLSQKVQKKLYEVAKWTKSSGCGCGGNCGCH